jgi:hypothetical protein
MEPSQSLQAGLIEPACHAQKSPGPSFVCAATIFLSPQMPARFVVSRTPASELFGATVCTWLAMIDDIDLHMSHAQRGRKASRRRHDIAEMIAAALEAIAESKILIAKADAVLARDILLPLL